MHFGVIGLFPEMVQAALDSGVVGRAVVRKQIELSLFAVRDFTTDQHRTVDDRPYGGGPGMVMKPEPLTAAIAAAKTAIPGARVVYLSPQGQAFDQALARDFQHQGSLILVAGRYEGIDERVLSGHIDLELSLGDFVLSGGEIAAMAIIDAVSRLVPGVLGHPLSVDEDSFGDKGLLDCPHYTRPEVFEGQCVPAVLLSGDHQAIAAWRHLQSLTRTWERRADLLATANLGASDREFLQHLEQTQIGSKSSSSE